MQIQSAVSPITTAATVPYTEIFTGGAIPQELNVVRVDVYPANDTPHMPIGERIGGLDLGSQKLQRVSGAVIGITGRIIKQPYDKVPSLDLYFSGFSQHLRHWGFTGTTVHLPNVKDVYKYAEKLDGIIFGGGSDPNPELYHQKRRHDDRGMFSDSPEYDIDRDNREMQLLRTAKAIGVPVLGVCRGSQMLGIEDGYTQHLHDPSGMKPKSPQNVVEYINRIKTSQFEHLVGAVLFENIDALGTNSIHHRRNLEKRWSKQEPRIFPVGKTASGCIEIISTLNDDGWWALGVQGHPELFTFTQEFSKRVFVSFIDQVVEFYGKRSVAQAQHLRSA